MYKLSVIITAVKDGVKKMQNAAYNGVRTEFSLRTNLLVKKRCPPASAGPDMVPYDSTYTELGIRAL